MAQTSYRTNVRSVYMKHATVAAAAILIIFLLCAGCTQEKQNPVTAPPTTTVPEPTTVATAVPTTDVQPVQTLPSAQQVYLVLQKDRVYSTITLTFNGGPGLLFTDSVEMKVTRSDGGVIDKFMDDGAKPKSADTLDIPGTRGSDHCEVWVTSAGVRYKVMEEDLVLGGFYGF